MKDVSKIRPMLTPTVLEVVCIVRSILMALILQPTDRLVDMKLSDKSVSTKSTVRMPGTAILETSTGTVHSRELQIGKNVQLESRNSPKELTQQLSKSASTIALKPVTKR